MQNLIHNRDLVLVTSRGQGEVESSQKQERDPSVPGSYQPWNAALFVGEPTASMGLSPC